MLVEKHTRIRIMVIDECQSNDDNPARFSQSNCKQNLKSELIQTSKVNCWISHWKVEGVNQFTFKPNANFESL